MRIIKKEKNIDLIVAFRLFGRTSLIHFALLGRKRKYVKLMTTAKFIEKRTSIAAVRAKLGQIGTFLTPLLSHCGLPLRPMPSFKFKLGFWCFFLIQLVLTNEFYIIEVALPRSKQFLHYNGNDYSIMVLHSADYKGTVFFFFFWLIIFNEVKS